MSYVANDYSLHQRLVIVYTITLKEKLIFQASGNWELGVRLKLPHTMHAAHYKHKENQELTTVVASQLSHRENCVPGLWNEMHKD